jgi:uncharacterized membrane protein (DUF373 family)
MVMVVLGTVELGWLLLQDITTIRPRLLDVEEVLEVFGYFLLVLVGLELITSMKAYLYQRVIHVEVVLEVSLIAVAQKIIILDTRSSPLSMVGLAALLVALAVAFGVVRYAQRKAQPIRDCGEQSDPALDGSRADGT